MNILIIADQFPPLNTGGSHRPFKFAKLLPQFGIHPIILTPELIAHEGAKFDQNQLDNLNQELEIIRTPVKKLASWKEKLATSYYFNIEDTSAKKWEPFLIPVIAKLVEEREISAIYVTIPPFSIANMGRRIAQRFKLPFILDMRDAWSNWVVTPYATYLHYKLTKQAERKALEAADAIVTVSDQMIKDLQKLHPHISKENFHLITNAYDEERPKYPTTLSIAQPTEEHPLKIGYVGSFYYTPYQRDLVFNPWWKKKPYQYLQYVPRKEDWRYRSPHYFFKALSALFEKNPAFRKLIKVEFVGTVFDWMQPMIEAFGLEDVVAILGRFPHDKALAFQDSCDALLLTSVKVINGFDYCIAGKSFEYICRKKPILAVVTEGSQKRFIEETGLAVVCPADDVEESVSQLEQLITGKTTLRPNQDFIHQSHISQTTAQLASILKKLSR